MIPRRAKSLRFKMQPVVKSMFFGEIAPMHDAAEIHDSPLHHARGDMWFPVALCRESQIALDVTGNENENSRENLLTASCRWKSNLSAA
jgi:hypothetical protein